MAKRVLKLSEPKVMPCQHCDFSMGTRGMDRCARCDGTGSRFVVIAQGEAFYFPNTRIGYERAKAKMGTPIT